MKQGTPGFLGERLREAREARGLTAISLADLLGVTRAAVSQYELGLQTPRPEIVEKACKVLNLPLPFFKQVDGSFRFQVIFNRAVGSGTKIARTKAERRLEWLQRISEFLKQFLEFPAVNLPDTASALDSSFLSPDFIETIASNVRTKWGLRDLPIGNLVRRAEDNGMVVGLDDMGSEALDSVCAWDQEHCQPYVMLASHVRASAFARYELARAIGHLSLHRNTARARLAMNNDFAVFKQQASLFARALLLPAAAFCSDLYSISLDAMRLLKQKWKVPIAIMIQRLQDLHVLSEEQAKKLWIGRSRRGWISSEPLDDELPLEQPKLLSESISLLVEEEIVSKQEILNALPFSDRDIEILAGLQQGYLTDTMPLITLLPEHRRRGPQPKDSIQSGQLLAFPEKSPPKEPEKRRKSR